MPVRGFAPRASSTVSWGGLRARPAQRQSRRPAARLSALSAAEFFGPHHDGRTGLAGPAAPVGGQALSTAAFEMVTAFFGAPSAAPPVTPAVPTAFTAFSEAASIVPNGV